MTRWTIRTDGASGEGPQGYLTIAPAHDAGGKAFVVRLGLHEMARFPLAREDGDQESRWIAAQHAAFLWLRRWRLGGAARERAMRNTRR